MTTMLAQKLATLGITALAAALVAAAPAWALSGVNGVALNGFLINGIALNGAPANALSTEGGSTAFDAGAVTLRRLTLRDGRGLVVGEEREAAASAPPPVVVSGIATSPGARGGP